MHLPQHPLEPAGPGAELELSSAEREVLAEEVEDFAQTLKDPDTRERYAHLGAAVQQGTVPPHLVGFLETMLELILPTQRVRRQHGPDAEQALLRLFHRTPRGAALAQAGRSHRHDRPAQGPRRPLQGGQRQTSDRG